MIFIDNKYTKYYFNIIHAAKSRTTDSEYTEKHHILPKSLNGSNNDDNLVQLTAREHFICHMLLPKMVSGQEKHKMLHAAIGMKRQREYQHRYINSRIYEQVKKDYAVMIGDRSRGTIASESTRIKQSLARKGKPKPNGFGEKVSNALKGRKKPPMSEELKKQISEKLKGRPSPNKGNAGIYHHSEETKQKIIESNKRRVILDETRAKISEGNRASYERRMETRRKNQNKE